MEFLPAKPNGAAGSRCHSESLDPILIIAQRCHEPAFQYAAKRQEMAAAAANESPAYPETKAGGTITGAGLYYSEAT